MKLPGGELSIVEIEKLRDYCLSFDQPRGQHKARVFLSLLGMTVANSQDLRAALMDAAKNEDASLGIADQYGKRYIIDFKLRHGSRTADL
jgi:hypothetical protein